MKNTWLELHDHLPLTCTREGTCCHGKQVWVNPWELDVIAAGRGIAPAEFRRHFTDCGGIRLKFDGPRGFGGLASCSQYKVGQGCLVHHERPLACRLYPLGRQLQNDQIRTFHHGTDFPCIKGCPQVTTLPTMTVANYLEQQQIGPGECARILYLKLAQEVADGAFVLLLETGLAASGDRATLRRWQQLGKMSAEVRARALPEQWLGPLTLVHPDNALHTTPDEVATLHQIQLQGLFQEAFGSPQSAREMSEGSSTLFGLALHLAQSVGADTHALARHWIDVAKGEGAKD